jgi:hypothetical protein
MTAFEGNLRDKSGMKAPAVAELLADSGPAKPSLLLFQIFWMLGNLLLNSIRCEGGYYRPPPGIMPKKP